MASSKRMHLGLSGIEPPNKRPKGYESMPLYDVFINHRGPDSKDALARPIYEKLKKLGIRVFLDKEELELGQSFPPAIETAIASAAVHIAIFSKRYAMSAWCLAELDLMVQTRAMIIPVFYQVKPFELQHIEKGGYADAFNYHVKKSRYLEKLDGWKKAIQFVSKRTGIEVEIFSSSDCEKIVTAVQKEIQRTKPLPVADHPVALDKVVRDFEMQCLNKRQHFERHRGMNEGDQLKSEIIGVYGIGGVGKTTLCKALFNRMLKKYDRSCFLYDISEVSKQGKLASLQEKFLIDLFSVEKGSFHSTEEGSNSIFDHLSRSISLSFLIVLDDISHWKHLAAFRIMDMLKKPGDCLVIVSTRDEGELIRAGIKVRYHLEVMDQIDSRKLFCFHAFAQSHPEIGYEDLVNGFIDVCGGSPLSLVVLGRHVRDRDFYYWKTALDKYKKTLHGDIKQKLKISFDALEAEEQQIFIDIACYFVDNLKETAIRVWKASGWRAENALKVLQDGCLVEEIEDFEPKLRMHDNLRTLGRDLAEEASHPLRLWRQQHLKDLELKGFENILNHTKKRCFHSFYDETIKSRVRFLLGETNDTAARSASLLLLELHADGYFSDSIPSWIPLQNIQSFTIYNGSFSRLWQQDVQPPSQLRFLQISGTSLREFPDYLGISTNVEDKIVEGQHSATEVALSLLEDLVISEQDDIKRIAINGNHCPKLKSVELSCLSSLIELMFSNCKELGRLDCLKIIECENLRRLSVTSNLTMLEELNISECPQLAETGLNCLINLRKITIANCKLKSVPGISNFRKLVELNISECPMLMELSLSDLGCLGKVVIENCSNLRSVTGISNLPNLVVLNISQCWKLQLELCLVDLSLLKSIIVELVPKIKSFELNGCKSLESVAGENADIKQLQMVNISACPNLNELPVICGASCLESIQINECLKLSSLVLTDCRVLKRLSGIFDLAELTIKGCHMLEELPCFENSTRLEKIQILECPMLESDLHLSRSNCLHSISVENCSIRNITLPLTVRELKLHECGKFQRVSGSETFTELMELYISECPMLESDLHLSRLNCLHSISVENCSIRDITLPLTVRKLKLHKCEKLQRVAGSETFTELMELYISECPMLEGDLHLSRSNHLHSISVENCSIRKITLPLTVRELKLLKCEKLQRVAGSETFTELMELYISVCPMLEGDLILSRSNCLHSISVENCSIRNITLPLTVRELKLHDCGKLERIAGMEIFTEFTEVHISECPELEEVPSLARANHIDRIQIVQCDKLHNISLPKKFSKVTVKRCGRLQRIAIMPDFMEDTELNISECAEVEELLVFCGPSRLEKITIGKAPILNAVRCTVDRLHMAQLWISDCPDLEEAHFAGSTCIEKIDILSCGKLKEMTMSTTLKVLHLDSCKELQSVFFVWILNAVTGNLEIVHLAQLWISDCPELEKACLARLTCLEEIKILRCGKLKEISLPKTLKVLHLDSCTELQSVSEISHLNNLVHLNIFQCWPLELKFIHLEDMNSLRSIEIDRCGNVKSFLLKNCQNLNKVSVNFEMQKLSIFDCPEFKELCLFPALARQLLETQTIHILSCDKLQNIRVPTTSIELIPERCGHLPGIEGTVSDILIKDCPELYDPGNVWHMWHCERISISSCERLHRIIPSKSAVKVSVSRCRGLERVEAGLGYRHVAIGHDINLQSTDSTECPIFEVELRRHFEKGLERSVTIKSCEQMQWAAWIQEKDKIGQYPQTFLVGSTGEIMKLTNIARIQLVRKAAHGAASKLNPSLLSLAHCFEDEDAVASYNLYPDTVIVCGVVEGSSSAQHAINRESEYYERSFDLGPGDWIITAVLPTLIFTDCFWGRRVDFIPFPHLVDSIWWRYLMYLPTAGKMKKWVAWATSEDVLEVTSRVLTTANFGSLYQK